MQIHDRDRRFTIGEITGLRPRKPWHDDKTCYKSEEAAQAAIRGLVRRGERETGRTVVELDIMHAYECFEGGVRHFHVGRQRKGGGRS